MDLLGSFAWIDSGRVAFGTTGLSSVDEQKERKDRQTTAQRVLQPCVGQEQTTGTESNAPQDLVVRGVGASETYRRDPMFDHPYTVESLLKRVSLTSWPYFTSRRGAWNDRDIESAVRGFQSAFKPFTAVEAWWLGGACKC
jgi:hypothetical protein